MIHFRQRVLPRELFFRNFRSEIACARTHVAMRELEPRARERVGELIGMLHEASRDFLVRGIEAKREIGREHRRRNALRRVMRARNRVRARVVFGFPLMRACGALRELPLVAEEVLEEFMFHFVGVVVHVTSSPLVIASTPIPVLKPLFQPKPCASMSLASGFPPKFDAGPAPCVLPKLCPPAINATVSSSFIAMRGTSRECPSRLRWDRDCRLDLPD